MPQEKAQELPHAMVVGRGSWLIDPSSGVYRAASLDRGCKPEKSARGSHVLDLGAREHHDRGMHGLSSSIEG
jgi:hypothetical protein